MVAQVWFWFILRIFESIWDSLVFADFVIIQKGGVDLKVEKGMALEYRVFEYTFIVNHNREKIDNEKAGHGTIKTKN